LVEPYKKLEVAGNSVPWVTLAKRFRFGQGPGKLITWPETGAGKNGKPGKDFLEKFLMAGDFAYSL
jgi:hypothetical protein